MTAGSPPALAREPLERPERKAWLLALCVAALIGVALRWPALEVGQLSDDYMQYAMIEGLYPGEGYVPFDLYAFARAGDPLAMHVDAGTVPWFAEPEFHASVFRPLASALLWLDHTLAPGRVRLWHLHSLLWFAGAIVAFGLCARRLLPRWPAAIAVALFVCDSCFVSPLGWIANRCSIVCALFGFLALYVHLEWRRPELATPAVLRRHGRWIELALLAACFGAGEYGFGVVAYLFAWELLAGGRDAITSADGWASRARALIPATSVVVIYMAFHTLLDYGTFGADVYADPLHSPLGWFKWLKLRIPILATAAFWSIPAASVHVFFHPGGQWWNELWPAADPVEVQLSHMRLGVFGIGLAALVLGLARAGLHDDERRTIRVLLLGGLLGLLPVSVAPTHERLLVVTQLAACSIVALLPFACWRMLRRPGWLDRLRGAAMVPFVGLLALGHVVGDLDWNHRYLIHLAGMQRSDALGFSEGDLLDQELEGRDVIVLNGPSQTVGMYGPFLLHSQGLPTPASWRSLALGGEHAMFAFRPDANTLDLAAVQGAWLLTSGELFFRRAEFGVPTGTVFDYPSLRAEVLADDGEGHPTKVRFRFPHSLDDPRYLFLTSTRRGLMRWPVPAIKGSAIVPLPRQPIPVDLVDSSIATGSTGPK
ncbi:hypothetical protein ACNOYE_08220 [Nannocystaceae bacterium ST9]